jgi:hypothetical protein
MIVHTIYAVKKSRFSVNLTSGNDGLSNVRRIFDGFSHGAGTGPA